MCNFNTLKYNDYGYVMQCNDCNHLQVAFGTVILSLTPDQFHELIETAEQHYMHHNPYPFREEKIIRMPTPARSVMMVFSLHELKELLNLLVAGRDKLQYRQLFILNQN